MMCMFYVLAVWLVSLWIGQVKHDVNSHSLDIDLVRASAMVIVAFW